MKYPELKNTPIKEIIFSVSYKEIVDKNCFESFLQLEKIKTKFNDIKPSINQKFEFKEGGSLAVSSDANGFHLRNKNEILQLRRGSFSFHYLNGYEKFGKLLNLFSEYWNDFDNVTKDLLTVTNYSVRYINVIEIDDENQPTHLVQLYPKQSGDRIISNFQNSIQFSYKENPAYVVNAVSTKIDQRGILLDISVNGEVKNIDNKNIILKNLFKPLQDIKNKAFFDSITARALIKYINKTNKS